MIVQKKQLDKAKLQPNSRGLFMKIQRSFKKVFIDNTKYLGLKKYYDAALHNEDFFAIYKYLYSV